MRAGLGRRIEEAGGQEVESILKSNMPSSNLLTSLFTLEKKFTYEKKLTSLAIASHFQFKGNKCV